MTILGYTVSKSLEENSMTMGSRRGAWAEAGYRGDHETSVAPVAVVPEQLVVRTTSPEQRLLAAVLDQALQDLRIFRAVAPSGRNAVAVADWFRSRDTTWPCSFESICGALGFDADAIRSRVLPPPGSATRTRPGRAAA